MFGLPACGAHPEQSEVAAHSETQGAAEPALIDTHMQTHGHESERNSFNKQQ